ncbi:MAG: hypothetical protein ABI778_08275 [Ignavibacteriota bacterium]
MVILFGFIGCDRGATEQIQAAEKFADAVVRNNSSMRDSMIATRLFKKHFENEFVRSSFIEWMSSFYDIHTSKFKGSARADVDRDLKTELSAGGLLSSDEIEESGMVRIKSPEPTALSAYFWMVKQKGHHWAVAMVTKGEMAVNFRQ